MALVCQLRPSLRANRGRGASRSLRSDSRIYCKRLCCNDASHQRDTLILDSSPSSAHSCLLLDRLALDCGETGLHRRAWSAKEISGLAKIYCRAWKTAFASVPRDDGRSDRSRGSSHQPHNGAPCCSVCCCKATILRIEFQKKKNSSWRTLPHQARPAAVVDRALAQRCAGSAGGGAGGGTRHRGTS